MQAKAIPAGAASLYAGGATLRELGALYGCSEATIHYHLKRQQVGRRGCGGFKTRYPEILRAYQSGKTSRAIAAEYGCTQAAACRIVRRCGGAIRTTRRETSYTLNEAVFDQITPESAYWVGFLMADGCVHHFKTNRKPAVTLTLAKRDAAHVEAFRTFLGSNYALSAQKGVVRGKTHHSVSHVVRSGRLAGALARFGVVPAKSSSACVRLLTENADFWRGVVDGDGSISLRSRNPGKKKFLVLQVAGSRPLMEQFAAFAGQVLGQPAPRVYSYEGRGISTVALSHNRALRLVSALYRPGCIALPRKMSRVSEALRECGS